VAARKRTDQPALFVVAATEPAKEYVAPVTSADEPHITPIVSERRFELVPPPPEEDVTIEPMNDGRFVVAVLRHYGGSVCAVIYTRAQLEMLLRRIPPALEVG
jgi:hypothetical protein